MSHEQYNQLLHEPLTTKAGSSGMTMQKNVTNVPWHENTTELNSN